MKLLKFLGALLPFGMLISAVAGAREPFVEVSKVEFTNAQGEVKSFESGVLVSEHQLGTKLILGHAEKTCFIHTCTDFDLFFVNTNARDENLGVIHQISVQEIRHERPWKLYLFDVTFLDRNSRAKVRIVGQYHAWQSPYADEFAVREAADQWVKNQFLGDANSVRWSNVPIQPGKQQ